MPEFIIGEDMETYAKRRREEDFEENKHRRSYWGPMGSASKPVFNESFLLTFTDNGNGTVEINPIVGDVTPTFTRATPATTVNSTGQVVSVASGSPRSYYDPTSLAYLGYLAEGARTNLCLQSEDLATTWTNTNSTESVNATTAPDGAATADKLVEDATVTALHTINQAITWAAAAHTISVFAKQGERTWFAIHSTDGTTGRQAYFNLATGAIGTLTNSTATIKAYPNGWYLCTMTGTTNYANAAGTFSWRLATGDAGDTYTGNGTSGAFFWGGQVEAAAFASSYIPTTTASVTRNADVLTYPTSPWLNATEGTLFASFRQPATLTASNRFAGIFLAADPSNERLFSGNVNATTITGSTFAGGVSQASLTLGSSAASAAAKAVYAYKLNDFAGTVNGGTVATDTSGTLPTVDTLRVGHDGAGAAGTELFAPISRIAYFNSRLPNGSLQAITS